MRIDERLCIVFFVVVKKWLEIDFCLEVFKWMVDCGVRIIVYLLIIVVEVLCRRGEVEKSRKLVREFY